MHFVFFTYGLRPNNANLMPWRYVLEIAGGAAAEDHESVVISDGKDDEILFSSNIREIIQVGGSFSDDNPRLREIYKKFKPDVIVYPVARRTALTRKMSCVPGALHIAYFPGAWCDRLATFSVLRHLPAQDALMYGLESLIPGQWLVKTLKAAGVDAIFTLTDVTARKMTDNGWDQSRLAVVPPGINPPTRYSIQPAAFIRWRPTVAKNRHFLFMGPPKAIRGIHILLKAFDRVAAEDSTSSLVCLVRGGSQIEKHELDQTLLGRKHRSRVHIVMDSLTPADITAFIASCHAVVLPFLLVPSEIPLAVLEALAQKKPVLVSESGGTSEYVSDAGLIFPPGDVAALTECLRRTLSDAVLYSKMCSAAASKAEAMPTWREVSRTFYDFACRIAVARTSRVDPS